MQRKNSQLQWLLVTWHLLNQVLVEYLTHPYMRIELVQQSRNDSHTYHVCQ